MNREALIAAMHRLIRWYRSRIEPHIPEALIAAMHRLVRWYRLRVEPRLREEKTRRRLFVGGSFAAGCLCFVALMNVIVMPVYLREGLETRVPDFRGESNSDAANTARRITLSLVVDGEEYDDEVPTGSVSSQRPLPGTLVKPGRRVHVILSLGKKVFKVPDVTGKSPRDAELTLRDAGLVLKRTLYRSSKRFPPGVVVDQVPGANDVVSGKTGVTLYVAR